MLKVLIQISSLKKVLINVGVNDFIDSIIHSENRDFRHKA